MVDSLPKAFVAAFMGTTYTASTLGMALGLPYMPAIAAYGLVVHSDLQGIVFIRLLAPVSQSKNI